MAKLPSFQFYPGDWRKDPAVQSLSYHDRGVWFEIICLLHECEPRGKLMLNGVAMPTEALARLLGLDNQILTTTLTTLLTYGVAQLCEETGAIYSSRMVRDEENRQKAKENGASGGSPKLTSGYSAPGFLYAIRDPETRHIKIGIATNYNLRIKKIGYKMKRQMETLLVQPVDDMGTKEAQVHAELASMRVSGEWFKIPDDFIPTLMGIMKGNEWVDLRVVDKGKERASSSSSSSSSSNNNHILTDEDKPVSKKNEKPNTVFSWDWFTNDGMWPFERDRTIRIPEFAAATPEQLDNLRSQLIDYCKAKGKEYEYHDYRALLHKSLRDELKKTKNGNSTNNNAKGSNNQRHVNPTLEDLARVSARGYD